MDRVEYQSMVIQDHDGILDLDDLQEGDPLQSTAPELAASSGSDQLIVGGINRYVHPINRVSCFNGIGKNVHFILAFLSYQTNV